MDQTNAPPPAGFGRAAPDKFTAFQYDGRLGELYWIFIKNLLLSIITLGIFRFWGKTRIRRYLWSHTSLAGDRFEYTGTGGELFIGFIIVMVALLELPQLDLNPRSKFPTPTRYSYLPHPLPHISPTNRLASSTKSPVTFHGMVTW